MVGWPYVGLSAEISTIAQMVVEISIKTSGSLGRYYSE